MLVEFFAPWCHHCQDLAPEWEKASAALAVSREFILGRADCVGTGKELCDKFGIQMFPMIKLFRHGVFQQDFDGDRKADAIVKFLQQSQSESAPQQANNDPWQTGASFQNAYPMPTAPVYPEMPAAQAYAPVQQAPVQNPFLQTYSPTPELHQSAPALERHETQPVAAPAPAAQNGNYWPFNALLNQMNAAPSIMAFGAPNYKAPAPFVVKYAPQAGPHQAGFQKSEASSSFQYNSRNNRPFQANTETYQTGFAPPTANIALPANQLAGAFQGQLNTQGYNPGQTFFSMINGQPYAIRRIVNRQNGYFPPHYANPFQPYQRYGPGFLRGDSIPHVMRESDANRAKATPQRQIVPLRTPSKPKPRIPAFKKNAQKTPLNLHLINSQRPKPTQRFVVNKPNYLQMFSNFLQSQPKWKSPQNRQQIAYAAQTRRPSIQPSQTAMNTIFQNYKAKLSSMIKKAQPVYPARQNPLQYSGLPQRYQQNTGARYVVSIRGQPGSNAVSALRKKALYDPRFLSSLLKSRSNVGHKPQSRQPYLTAWQRKVWQRKMYQQQQQLQRRRSMLLPNRKTPLRFTSPSAVNVPHTDRALIRAKVLRPDLMAHARWAAKGTATATTRGNVVYVPRNAFTRLPPWYRPKLGPALVKYVVKNDNAKNQLPLLMQANKKQALMHPAPVDIWHQIYNFYNKKNVNNFQETPFNSFVNKFPGAKSNTGPKVVTARPFQPPVTANKAPGIALSQPQYDTRSYLVNPRQPTMQRNQRLNYNQLKYKSSVTPSNGKPKPQSFKAFTKGSKAIPAELWDKRSYIRSSERNTIPHRSRPSGNWGTMKKKRGVFLTDANPRSFKRNRHYLRKKREKQSEDYRQHENSLSMGYSADW